MKTGVLGGTFNPPHNGHLAAAKHVREALGLDRVLFIRPTCRRTRRFRGQRDCAAAVRDGAPDGRAV